VVAPTYDAVQRFRYEYRSHEEGSGGVTVECISVVPGQRPLRIHAKKLIKAFGLDVSGKAPLALSSTLDTIRERLGVRCGVLQHHAPSDVAAAQVRVNAGVE
jgi:hypothetical protein